MSYTGTSSQNGSSQTPWRAVLSQTGLPTHSSTCTKVHGLDCELVHTMNGLKVARARIEDMHYFDTFVLPQYEIVSLNTAFSGITRIYHLAHLNVIDTERWLLRNVYITIERSSTTLKGASSALAVQLIQASSTNPKSLNTTFNGITEKDLSSGSIPMVLLRMLNVIDTSVLFTPVDQRGEFKKLALQYLALQMDCVETLNTCQISLNLKCYLSLAS
ncbi:hypothetical protein B9Z55_022900 [Caenorhabditis nigoni]|uniref:Uncharacterized protein n=1 Tax=Caenorhabditis nigoni TaxID=1611254 RepID=A0A2G5SMH5_9PELO|nr:hypothetical protein B9Z55_022900 [Caenorhabditis nigoni]